MAQLSNKRRPIVIANWKLNGNCSFVEELLEGITEQWQGVHQAEVVVCPAHVHLSLAGQDFLSHSNIALGAQDCSQFEEGAYTGDVSAEMLQDLGCQYVIVGHSERRRFHCETDSQVARKFSLAHQSMMTPILCVGETQEQREQGKTLEVIKQQVGAVLDFCGADKLARCVVAYEPLWAVGTGVTATPDQAQEVHAFIRGLLGAAGHTVRVVYGGSVKPDNAEALFEEPDIDGALVGGAALKADDFIEICRAAE